MEEKTRVCDECGRTVPYLWAIPFTTRWGKDPKTGEFRSYRGLYGTEFADCNSCCDKPITTQDLAWMGVNWGGVFRG